MIRALLLLALLLGSGGRALAQAPATGFSLRPANPDPTRPGTQAYFIHTVDAGQSRADEALAAIPEGPPVDDRAGSS